MQNEAILNQLGYAPNDALLAQIERIAKNTAGYEKIIKHIMDLHEALKVNGAYVAMSNSEDVFKIKLDSPSTQMLHEAIEKIERFRSRYKVELDKVEGKPTYYIVGFRA
ncbi:MAG: hypothetical protein WCR69_07180 [Sulfuricurvum sp.]